MKPVVVLILVIVIGLLAVAVFVLGVGDPLLDLDVASLSKKWQDDGAPFGPGDVDCSDCSAHCQKNGPLRTITLSGLGNCNMQVLASNAKVRVGTIRITRGEAMVEDLVYGMEDDQEMEMGKFKLRVGCPGSGCGKARAQRDLQFGEPGGRFTVKCLAEGGCKLLFPAQD